MPITAEKLAWLNRLPEAEAAEALLRCCGSTRWVVAMTTSRPFTDETALFAAADRIWERLDTDDRLEAFTHHPRLGAAALAARFASTASWAGDEQKGVRGASPETLEALASGNAEYERKFGFVFLLCATGKSADEMLAALRQRLPHDAMTEVAIAAREQAKITRLRLEKLLT